MLKPVVSVPGVENRFWETLHAVGIPVEIFASDGHALAYSDHRRTT